MKKLFAGLILAVASLAALASPRPSEIENALAAHDYQSAKSMTQEVLREHPNSARAHLLNAYILLHADHDKSGAAAELKNARLLDNNHTVATSALFGRTAAELETSAPVPKSYSVPARSTYVAPAPYVAPAGESALVKLLKFLFWATIIGLIVYVVYRLICNRRTVVSCTGHTYHYEAPADVSLPAGGSLQPRYENHGRTYLAPPHPVYQTAPVESRYDVSPRPVVVQPAVVQPSTVVVNGGSNNGLIEGMMLNEMMHSHHHSRDYDSPRVIERDVYVEREAAPAYQRGYPSDTTDYETKRTSFVSSSGGDDDWDRNRSSGSSNIFDSGGSSGSDSFFDSGSSGSADSGGGGGGWD